MSDDENRKSESLRLRELAKKMDLIPIVDACRLADPRIPEHETRSERDLRELRQALERFGTHANAAQALGVTASTVKNWASGRTRPHGVALNAIFRPPAGTVLKGDVCDEARRRVQMLCEEARLEEGDEAFGHVAGVLNESLHPWKFSASQVRCWYYEENAIRFELAQDLCDSIEEDCRAFEPKWKREAREARIAEYRASRRDSLERSRELAAMGGLQLRPALRDGERAGKRVPRGDGEPEFVTFHEASRATPREIDERVWTCDEMVASFGGWGAVNRFYGRDVLDEYGRDERARAYWWKQFAWLYHGRRVYRRAGPLEGVCIDERERLAIAGGDGLGETGIDVE